MNVCDNLGDHLVGNIYVKVSYIFCKLKNTVLCADVCGRFAVKY